jgi:DNA-binding response OmpR family regulator
VTISDATTVAIIDDDPDVAELLEALVATHDGYRVVDGPFRGRGVDVVIVGAHRNEGDGIATVARARAVAPKACIALLVPCVDPITLLDALANGADVVLSDAAAWRELLPTLSGLLRHRRAAASAAAPVEVAARV